MEWEIIAVISPKCFGSTGFGKGAFSSYKWEWLTSKKTHRGLLRRGRGVSSLKQTVFTWKNTLGNCAVMTENTVPKAKATRGRTETWSDLSARCVRWDHCRLWWRDSGGWVKKCFSGNRKLMNPSLYPLPTLLLLLNRDPSLLYQTVPVSSAAHSCSKPNKNTLQHPLMWKSHPQGRDCFSIGCGQRQELVFHDQETQEDKSSSIIYITSKCMSISKKDFAQEHD